MIVATADPPPTGDARSTPSTAQHIRAFSACFGFCLFTACSLASCMFDRLLACLLDLSFDRRENFSYPTCRCDSDSDGDPDFDFDGEFDFDFDTDIAELSSI
jgi:hypothetical protein